jgi:hypothetical protein
VFIQTTICRRKVLEKIFKNAPSSKFPAQHHQPCSLLTTYTDVPAASCCDLCNPSLLDRIRPGQPPAIQRQSTIKRGVMNDAVRDALYAWRRTIKRQHYPKAVWAPQAILDNGTCELLASVGPITTMACLAQLIQSTWHRWEKHSGDLFKLLLTLNIPPLQVPAKTASNKRAATASSSQPSTSSKRP